jgi:hypothetical protein
MERQLFMTVQTSLAAQGVTSYYLGAICMSVKLDQIFFRLLNSFDTERMTSKWKFPGGDAEKLETPGEVAWREWKEEALRPNSQVALGTSKAVLVHQKDGPDQDHPGGIHRKMFYLFDEKHLINFKGDMHFRASATPDGMDILSNTVELPIFAVGKWLDENGAHLPAFIEAVKYIANTRKDLFPYIPDRLLNYVFSTR